MLKITLAILLTISSLAALGGAFIAVGQLLSDVHYVKEDMTELKTSFKDFEAKFDEYLAEDARQQTTRSASARR